MKLRKILIKELFCLFLTLNTCQSLIKNNENIAKDGLITPDNTLDANKSIDDNENSCSKSVPSEERAWFSLDLNAIFNITQVDLKAHCKSKEKKCQIEVVVKRSRKEKGTKLSFHQSRDNPAIQTSSFGEMGQFIEIKADQNDTTLEVCYIKASGFRFGTVLTEDEESSRFIMLMALVFFIACFVSKWFTRRSEVIIDNRRTLQKSQLASRRQSQRIKQPQKEEEEDEDDDDDDDED